MTKSRDTADSINRIDSSAADATAITIDTNENVLVGNTSSIGTTIAGKLQTSGIESFITTNSEVGGFIGVNSNADNSLAIGADPDSDRAGSHIAFYVDGLSEKMRIDSSGNVGIGTSPSVKLDIDNGSLKVNRGNSSGDIAVFRGLNAEKVKIDTDGIKFNGDTASANALDDYEEGTFNPFSGVSSAYTNETTDNAQYRKIGGVVHIDIRFDWTGTDNSASSASFALPFTASGTTNTANAGSIFYSGTQLKSGASLSPHVGINSSLFSIYRGDGGSFETVRRNEVNGSYEFLISFTYFTND